MFENSHHQSDNNDGKNLKVNYKKKKIVLIVGESMVNDIEESKLLETSHIRVQPIPGAKTEDIKQNLDALLHEDLEADVIHAATNKSIKDTLQNILDKLIKSKNSIEELPPRYQVIISKLVVRRDISKADDTNRSANELIKTVKIQTVQNNNIIEKHFRKRSIFPSKISFAWNLL